MPKTKVYVLYTGGTIGMRPKDAENPASPLVPATKEELEPYVGQLGRSEGIEWIIEGLVDQKGNDVPPIDSSAVNPSHWIQMAKAIERVYDEYDGFVILHGTDTMAFTASALSFLLENLTKPVVITGSQLPIAAVRTDAVQNLVNAVYIAGYKATNLPVVPEVTICFADGLFRGNRATKVSTSDWQGYDSPNFPRLGTIGEHIEINEELVLPESTGGFFAHGDLQTNVMNLGLFPGLSAAQLRNLTSLSDLRGIVLETFGVGNAPEDREFLDSIKQITDSRQILLNVSQCVKGKVEMGLYAASSGLLERGVISGLDMTPEAALTKMMWLLATEDYEETQIQLQISQRGEQSESLFDVRYGEGAKRDQPEELVKSSARPSGQFELANLNRAVVRLSGIGATEVELDEEIALRIFINLPTADKSTPVDDPHCAGVFRALYAGPENTIMLGDVTSTVRRVVQSGRAIGITVVTEDGRKIWYKGLFLALFAKA